jgi:hypothetical protein
MSGNGPRCANLQVSRRLRKGHDPSSVFILSVLSVFALSVFIFALALFVVVLCGFVQDINPSGESGRHKRKGLGINGPG